eukprot:4309313-Amphidinium_carterae.2
MQLDIRATLTSIILRLLGLPCRRDCWRPHVRTCCEGERSSIMMVCKVPALPQQSPKLMLQA